ncbi:MAG TPA: alpha/beta hydrolase [Dongiaceae bacterium]|nr:alpha/beta hydrolase [Dongiaceae bacterium]
MSIILTILLIVALLYLAALLFLYLTQSGKIFPGSTMKPDLAATSIADRGQAIMIPGEAGPLLSWYFPARRADGRTICYFHGNAGSIVERVERVLPYLAIGYGALLVGYPGYGGNPGKASEESFYRTARANLDFLAKAGVAADQLILFGESLGTGVAVQMATERPALALVLEAPPASIPHSAWARYPYLAFEQLIRHKFASIEKIDKVRLPLLIIHGQRDRTTDVRFGRMLLARANEPKQGFFPPEAGHNDLMQHGMPEAVRAFLQELPA